MAKQAGLGCALYYGGYDIGGDTQSFTVHGGPAALDMTDITQSAYARLGGERDAAIDWVSFHDPAVLASHAALSPLLLTDQIATALIGPIAIGCPAVSQLGKQVNYDPTRGQDGMLTFAISEQASGFGQEWGVALTPGRRVDGSATAAAAGNSFDTGASASFGAQAYVQLLAFAGTSVTISIWDSADNITFLAVAGFTTGALNAANQSVRISIGNTATVRRYVAVATVGTFTNADFVVQLTKNNLASVVF